MKINRSLLIIIALVCLMVCCSLSFHWNVYAATTNTSKIEKKLSRPHYIARDLTVHAFDKSKTLSVKFKTNSIDAENDLIVVCRKLRKCNLKGYKTISLDTNYYKLIFSTSQFMQLKLSDKNIDDAINGSDATDSEDAIIDLSDIDYENYFFRYIYPKAETSVDKTEKMKPVNGGKSIKSMKDVLYKCMNPSGGPFQRSTVQRIKLRELKSNGNRILYVKLMNSRETIDNDEGAIIFCLKELQRFNLSKYTQVIIKTDDYRCIFNTNNIPKIHKVYINECDNTDEDDLPKNCFDEYIAPYAASVIEN